MSQREESSKNALGLECSMGKTQPPRLQIPLFPFLLISSLTCDGLIVELDRDDGFQDWHFLPPRCR